MTGIRVIIEEEAKFAGDYDWPGLTKGGATSVFGHALIFFLVILATHHQAKKEVVLTEISLVDQIIPIPEEEAPPPMPVAPPKEKNVWDFLKQAIPVKQQQALAPELPINLPKQQKQELAAMPQALDLGSKKNLDQPALANQPLDLVGRKAVQAPAGMDLNPMKIQRKNESLATSSQLPTGIQIGAKSSWLPQAQAPIVSAGQFDRRANLQARGGALADMPTIKKPEEKKKVDFDTSSLKMERSGNTFKIFGPLQNRPILEKYLPRYPRWAEEQGLECNVSLHFFVLPNGMVKDNLFVEQGSGYSEMDSLAMKALRAFKFAPIASGEEQEGVIVFYFRLSR
jgi:TonB family protein